MARQMRTLTLLPLLAACATAPASQPSFPPGAVPPADTGRITHLLGRAAFGPSPRDVARVRELGLDGWLAEQLAPGEDPAITRRLSGFRTLGLSVAEAHAAYPPLDERLKEAGVDRARIKEEGRRALVRQLEMDPDTLPRQLLVEATQARLIRAITSRRQLEEVLVDFWFNHFNVSAEKGRVRWMVSAYERDAIRPHVLGSFLDMLRATARHPAMLWYLDNWLSVRDGFELPPGLRAGVRNAPKGLNENYARELLELHTLGVNGGYTQADVRDAARALTGWSLQFRPRQAGFGEFVYRPFANDTGAKHVAGLHLAAGGQEDDGERLLTHLATHPATARHIAHKLCVRFIGDQPPEAVVEAVARVFLDTKGDLRRTVAAVLTSDAFWSPAAVGAKTKTPLEYVASAVRAVGELDEVYPPMVVTLERLGMPLYRCAPPTGYTDTAAPWVNAGALVSRINFALALTRGQVRGVEVALPPPGSSLEDTIDAVAAQVLGRPPTPATGAIVLRAASDELARRGDEGQPRPDVALIAGLLLGSPEFQAQ